MDSLFCGKLFSPEIIFISLFINLRGYIVFIANSENLKVFYTLFYIKSSTCKILINYLSTYSFIWAFFSEFRYSQGGIPVRFLKRVEKCSVAL